MTGNVADVFMPQYNGINGGTYPTSTLSPYLHTNPQDATKVTIFTANPYLQPPSIPVEHFMYLFHFGLLQILD